MLTLAGLGLLAFLARRRLGPQSRQQASVTTLNRLSAAAVTELNIPNIHLRYLVIDGEHQRSYWFRLI